jgi:hypothetical protein
VIRAWKAARLNYSRRGAWLVLRDAQRKGKSWERVEIEQQAMADGAFL